MMGTTPDRVRACQMGDLETWTAQVADENRAARMARSAQQAGLE